MQDYIEIHIASEITLMELAKEAMFSPWYAHRLFKEKTGITPAEYIRRLRLSMAAKSLKENGGRLTDIAFDLGFGSVDGFTRAFTREFGINPSEYRAHPVPVTLFIPYGVRFRELRKEEMSMDNLRIVYMQVIQKPERKVILKRGKCADDYWTYCSEVGCNVWGTLMSMDSQCGEPVCLWLPEKYREPNTSKYVQGVEVDTEFNEMIPEGFDTILLPPVEYLMFQGEPFNEQNYCEAIIEVQHAMNKYDPAAIGYAWDDDNPRIQLEPRGNRGYIKLRAIKRL